MTQDPTREQDLRARALRLVEHLKPYELELEEMGRLSNESRQAIKECVHECRLAAINMPTELGGQGLNTFEQVLVQEELGQLTNSLWSLAWHPANALRACTPEQRLEYLRGGSWRRG